MNYKEKVIALLNSQELSKEQKEKLEGIFPELRESEDEKIRKEIISYIKSSGAVTNQKWIAWLEKQGEQPQGKSALEAAKEEKIDNQNCVKPADKIEPKFKVKYAGSEYNVFEVKDIVGVTFYGIEDEPNHIDYVRAENCEIISGYVIKENGSPYPIKSDVFLEQNPADKVEPKFKVGDWIIHDKNIKLANSLMLVTGKDNNEYLCKDINGQCSYNIEFIDKNYHLWTIQDAKDGDVLAYVTDEEDLWIMIYWSLYKPYEGHVHYHALLVNDNFSDKGTCCICIDNLKPATKEQRELLFQKMYEAGYEWDAEKKELKKIEQKPTEDVNLPEFESYLCLMLQKFRTKGMCTNGEIIDYVKEHSQKLRDILVKPAWSEEDAMQLDAAINIVANSGHTCTSDWLKSLKDRLQPKQEWNKEDEDYYDAIIAKLEVTQDDAALTDNQMNFLKSLRPQNRWKPSLSQLNALGVVAKGNVPDDIEEINSLYNDLKKLKG